MCGAAARQVDCLCQLQEYQGPRRKLAAAVFLPCRRYTPGETHEHCIGGPFYPYLGRLRLLVARAGREVR